MRACSVRRINLRLLLIRHGETMWNLDGRYQGHSDTQLSLHGEAQARALANRFSASDVVSVVASPLLRAQATAQIIAARLNLPVTTDNRLMEIAYGQWEGLQQPEVKQRWPEMLRQWKQTPDQVKFPEGESLSGVQQRVRSFFEHMAEQVGTVLVVSHDGFARIAILEMQGKPLSAFREVHVENASVTTFIWEGGRFAIEGINDVAHLVDP